jgi:hypothetical protein
MDEIELKFRGILEYMSASPLLLQSLTHPPSSHRKSADAETLEIHFHYGNGCLKWGIPEFILEVLQLILSVVPQNTCTL